MIWNRLYNKESFCDKGTLKHLQNIIQHSNVPHTVKDNVSAAQDFYTLVTEAHIVAAATVHFSMHSLDGEPAGVAVPTESDPTTLRDFLMQTVGKLVDEYVLKFVEVNRMHETDDESSQSGLETNDQDD